mmetsp:Transcript_43624/g.136485  ORF Transcript_43624/g.136485 Transcript_43624/m.136485 type:complete len:236 (+) Transcript_43624:570-1277(+)
MPSTGVGGAAAASAAAVSAGEGLSPPLSAMTRAASAPRWCWRSSLRRPRGAREEGGRASPRVGCARDSVRRVGGQAPAGDPFPRSRQRLEAQPAPAGRRLLHAQPLRADPRASTGAAGTAGWRAARPAGCCWAATGRDRPRPRFGVARLPGCRPTRRRALRPRSGGFRRVVQECLASCRAATAARSGKNRQRCQRCSPASSPAAPRAAAALAGRGDRQAPAASSGSARRAGAHRG